MPADPKLIPQILQRWSRKQLEKLRFAFSVGGHQLHGGDRWVPLSFESGIRLPLRVTGALERSIFVSVSGVSVLIGSTSPIAIFHQNGTRSIPRRPVVELTRQDIESLKLDLKRTLES